MQGELLQNLIEKYLEGNGSSAEVNLLEKWYDSFDCQTDFLVADTLESSLAAAKGFSELKLKLGIL